MFKELWTWLRRKARNPFDIAIALCILGIVGVVVIVFNQFKGSLLDAAQSYPLRLIGLLVLIGFGSWSLKRRRQPHGDKDHFTVLVAEFEDDESNNNQKGLINELKNLNMGRKIKILSHEEIISIKGHVQAEAVAQAHSEAKKILKERHADLAIWGHWISGGQVGRIDLYAT